MTTSSLPKGRVNICTPDAVIETSVLRVRKSSPVPTGARRYNRQAFLQTIHTMLPHEKDNNLALLLASLGISDALLARKALPFHPDARELAPAETSADGRTHLLIPPASKSWSAMKAAAYEDGIVIEIVSAFRDVEEQAQIILDKQARGMDMEAILTLSAPPGYSEHHTGRAVDINTPGCEEREEPFEATEAFRWLTTHAARFGFVLSYPRGNALGFIYEPWHWFYQPGAQA